MSALNASKYVLKRDSRKAPHLFSLQPRNRRRQSQCCERESRATFDLSCCRASGMQVARLAHIGVRRLVATDISERSRVPRARPLVAAGERRVCGVSLTPGYSGGPSDRRSVLLNDLAGRLRCAPARPSDRRYRDRGSAHRQIALPRSRGSNRAHAAAVASWPAAKCCLRRG